LSQDPDPTTEGADDRDEESEEDTDLDGDESFPASDPPAHWMGEDRAD
jgi:hypothetical protein